MQKHETVSGAVAEEVLERFLRYAKVHTTSDESLAPERKPSTDRQWDLIRMLEAELVAMGVKDVAVDEYGYLIARIPGNLPEGRSAETIGFMAHVDTSGEAPGAEVNPIVHKAYDGGILELGEGLQLDPAEFPLLAKYVGETVITTDGTTLLGADDKAGVAEIVTAVRRLLTHPEIEHGDLEIIFTPDEETGVGMDRFPVESLNSSYCFTIDGGEEGELETECYNARKATINFTGRLIHPGSARGKMVNAVTMAGAFVSMLPRNESPEATDGRYGNYWPHKIQGSLESAELVVFYRSFDSDDIERRTEALRSFARAVEAAFPGGRATVAIQDQYRNMREEIDKHPGVLERLRRAYAASGVTPIEEPIRGGSDGSRLTAMGIPTPNIFAGGQNFHGRLEWVALPAMTRAVTVILNIICEWARK